MFNSDWLKIKPAAGNHYHTEAHFRTVLMAEGTKQKTTEK